MAAQYDIGDKITLEASFTDAGVLVDPTTVSCIVRSPSDEITERDVTGEAGHYTAEIEPNEAGTWWYRFEGTGAYQAAEEGEFAVRLRRVPAS